MPKRAITLTLIVLVVIAIVTVLGARYLFGPTALIVPVASFIIIIISGAIGVWLANRFYIPE